MNSNNYFMAAALRRFDYASYCRARGLHPCSYPLPGGTLLSILKFTYDNAFAAPYFAFILDAVYIAARAKYAIARLVVARLRRKMPEHTTADFSLEPLAQAPAHHLIHLYADRKKYTFRISDLLSVIHTALTHSMDFISSPLPIKNPYTGVALRPETLYIVYAWVHESRFFMPHLFENFIKAKQSMRHFTVQNECALREVILSSHIKNMPPKMVHHEVRQLFEEVRIFDTKIGGYRPIIPKHDLLPASCLAHFKPWLYAYFVNLYSFNPYLRQTAQKNLIKAMLVFVAENPTFGSVVKGSVCSQIKKPVRPVPLV
jgi:hypothetical protein